jgi:hypothetical protein
MVKITPKRVIGFCESYPSHRVLLVSYRKRRAWAVCPSVQEVAEMPYVGSPCCPELSVQLPGYRALYVTSVSKNHDFAHPYYKIQDVFWIVVFVSAVPNGDAVYKRIVKGTRWALQTPQYQPARWEVLGRWVSSHVPHERCIDWLEMHNTPCCSPPSYHFPRQQSETWTSAI